MACLGRYFVSGQPLHVIQRGNDRKPVFFGVEDYAQYREWLISAAGENELAVHAYGLMTNHVHLLVVPGTAQSLPRTMQSLGRRYVRHINGRYRRTGTLWEGRYQPKPGPALWLASAMSGLVGMTGVGSRMSVMEASEARRGDVPEVIVVVSNKRLAPPTGIIKEIIIAPIAFKQWAIVAVVIAVVIHRAICADASGQYEQRRSAENHFQFVVHTNPLHRHSPDQVLSRIAW